MMRSSIPFQKQEVEDYEQRRYRGLDQRIVHQRERKILEKILEGIKEESPRVLDIPSGYGRFSALFLERGWKLVSSDLSFHMVRRARERTPIEGSHSAVVSDATAGLPFKRGVFTLLVSMRFFHHLHQREERVFVLKEFRAITSRWIIISYYRRNAFHSLQRKLRRALKKSRTKICMISRDNFEREVSQAGLEVVGVFPLFRIFHSQSIALLKKG
ncbi:MAG: class I SAM-dependent methyltransferase [Candidatus Aminicenantales bacterium]